MRRAGRERFPHHRLQRKPLVSDPDMHHGTCVTHVPWCMSVSLNRGSGGKRSRHSRRMRNQQFYVFGKRPMVPLLPHHLLAKRHPWPKFTEFAFPNTWDERVKWDDYNNGIFWIKLNNYPWLPKEHHYNDVTMSAMASQITSLTIVYSTVIRAQFQEKIKAPRHWPLWGEFPAQMASNVETFSIWWRRHAFKIIQSI